MFEEPNEGTDEFFLPPFPKVVILDFSLVTGVDGSAVDVLADILSLCKGRDCKLFLCGMSTRVRQTMALAGIKPETTVDRKSRKLRFFSDLDSAMGKAEDYLLGEESLEEDEQSQHAQFLSSRQPGFCRALTSITEQHGIAFTKELHGLGEYASVVELEPNDVLYESQELERGLFFIEEGIMVSLCVSILRHIIPVVSSAHLQLPYLTLFPRKSSDRRTQPCRVWVPPHHSGTWAQMHDL